MDLHNYSYNIESDRVENQFPETSKNRSCIQNAAMMCIMPPQHSVKIFARRISTSLLRCRFGRRMTLVREERLDYIFSLHVTGHTDCLRVCLPSCRARDGRVLHLL